MLPECVFTVYFLHTITRGVDIFDKRHVFLILVSVHTLGAEGMIPDKSKTTAGFF